ncbi:hypothetical protein BDQ17DRAFT_1441453 [Cyathus striatus]|nr:hypothetical protein BDQ17DRAFT_1441453 [Cyathus striatus]
MPRTTERQQAEKALLDLLMFNTIAEEEARQSDSYSSDSSDSSDSSGMATASKSHSDNTMKSSSSSSSSSSSFKSNDSFTGHILSSLEELHEHRYSERDRKIPKTSENLNMLLFEYKPNHPDIFRSFTGLLPACFDSAVEILQDHPVFQNNANCEQMPVERQFAIALYRFRHYGNAASNEKVALWAGVSYGTVHNAKCGY